jgi:hypothetical protein
MLKSKQKYWLLLLASINMLVACKKDPQEPTDNELITNVKLKFTELGTTTITTFEWKDPDGDGGAAPTKFDKILLKPNKTYGFTIELFDDSKSPATNISEEVAGEADEHLFVYTPTPASLLTFTITDKDSKNYPIGLKAEVKTTTAGTGKLKVQLRHQPGSKNGTATPGSDDVNLDFDVEIK